LWAQSTSGGPATALAGTGGIFVVNGVDDGIVMSVGATSGHRALALLRVSDPTQHVLVTIGPATGGVSALSWARDGRWLLAFATPPA
jgi:hypothetical protein